MSETFESKVREAGRFLIEEPSATATARAYAAFEAPQRKWAKVLRTSLASSVRRSDVSSFQVAVQVGNFPVRIQFRRVGDAWTVAMRAEGFRMVGAEAVEDGWIRNDIGSSEPIAIEREGETFWIPSPTELAEHDTHNGNPI